MKYHLSYCSNDRQNQAEIAAIQARFEAYRTHYRALDRPAALCPHCERMGLIDRVDWCSLCGWVYIDPDLTAIIEEHHKLETRTYGVYFCEYEGCGIECVKHSPNEIFCHEHSEKHQKIVRSTKFMRSHSGSRKVKK